jgi:hypothetical protein
MSVCVRVVCLLEINRCERSADAIADANACATTTTTTTTNNNNNNCHTDTCHIAANPQNRC